MWCSCFSRQGIIQKKYGRTGFWQSQKRLQLGVQGDALVGAKPKTIAAGGSREMPRWGQNQKRLQLGGPGRCPGGGKAPIFFLSIKHVYMVIVRGEYRVGNISSHSVVTLNNVIFSTIISLSLINR